MRISWGEVTSKTKENINKVIKITAWTYLPVIWVYALSAIFLLKIATEIL